MVRVVKDYGERRDEFLEAAVRLMAAKGYEKTTIQEIIDAVGVSKGAFYHYFSSKEDVLDAIAERATEATIGEGYGALRLKELPAVEKLKEFMAASMLWKIQNLEVVSIFVVVLYNEKNARLRNRLVELSRSNATPLLLEVVNQGIRDGSFDVRHVRETVDLVVPLYLSAAEGMIRVILSPMEPGEKAKVIRRRHAVILTALERVLGAREGSLGRVPEAYVKRLSSLQIDGWLADAGEGRAGKESIA